MAAPTLNPHPLSRGFVELDERILAAAPGVFLVLAPNAGTAEAAAAHVERRAIVKGLPFLYAKPRAGQPVFREVQIQLGLAGSSDVDACAAEVAGTSGVLLVPLPVAGSWDRAVLHEVVRVVLSGTIDATRAPGEGPGVLLVVLACDGDAAADLDVESFDLGEKLTGEARRRWFAALAEHACADLEEDLLTLDSSVPSVRPASQGNESSIARGLPLLLALELAGRPWNVHDLPALHAAGLEGLHPDDAGHSAALALLCEAGAIRVDRGLASIARGFRDRAVELASHVGPPARSAVAALLEARFPADPWAAAQRAELLLRAGDRAAADVAHSAALALSTDPLARRELVLRWTSALLDEPAEVRLPLLVRCGERALDAGRAEEAHHWAELAIGVSPEDARVALLLGRAKVATGDLVAASVAFDRGARHAGADLVPLFHVELAEVAYQRGTLDLATAQAEAIAREAKAPHVVLEARNTLGKVLLAQSRWDEADRHFEEDAWLASSSGLRTAELRARSNRAIALLSRGLVDKARALFETVLAEGERHGEMRACAFALDNLAVVASHQHKYVDALELWEKAFRIRQQLGDRTAITHILGNLALIRLKLGLWEHAEHAIAFGRRMLGPGTPVARSAYFAICAAKVALMRGRTMQARREAQSAIPESRASGNAKYLAEALRVLARIELEEGDLARAGDALTAARLELTTEEGRAETAILEASLARASGNLDAVQADGALALARRTDNEELLIEALILLVELHRASGTLEVARRFVDQALLVREQVVSALPDDIRAAYLSRPDCVALDRLVALLAKGEPWSDAPFRLGSKAPGSREGALPDADAVPSSPGARIEQRGPRGVASPNTSLGGSVAPPPDGDVPTRTLVGDDPQIRALLAAVRKVATTSCTVLIRGESGTGKELVAQAVHAASDRALGPLVTVNCAALVETLLLSELFGHEKGAFTGAAARRRGRFELAEGGTLFLDEIGDISPRTQVALLRVLQERTFERVGGALPIRVNVRIVCATHRDLKAMVERGEFRQDLYYRLRGVTLDVPPLRMRMGDLPLISEHLLARIARERTEPKKTLSADAVELLCRHRWPGNVRELENALRAASLFADSATISALDLVRNVDDLRTLSETGAMSPPSARFDGEASGAPSRRAGVPRPEGDDDDGPASADGGRPEATSSMVAYERLRGGGATLSDIKKQIERDCIARALAETKGNITRAAALLGMKRPRLSQLVKHYGLSQAASSEAS